ncbi:hypothetical protein, partial [Aphanizomenon flos-aquae]|uniref:hypothetical protein n=1 Tax=Aphanizomenon flos-aquae TaxID=1176 RepID=UPI001F26EA4C
TYPYRPLPYQGMGFSKPLPASGRGLERGQFIHSKLFKHPLRHIRNHPGFQLSALEKDGSLFVGGQGKRGQSQKSSKSKKGFCKEK